MGPRAPFRGALAVAALAIVGPLASALAQVSSPSDAYPDKYPRPLAGRKDPAPPKLALDREGEAALPGPVVAGPLGLLAGAVVVPLQDAVAVVPADLASEAEVRDLVDPPRFDPPVWVVSEDRRWRYRAETTGRILAEKRGDPSTRWRRAWRLRVAGGTPSPPLLLGRQLVFSSLDDQVYCVRADNGHRVWVTDLGERVSRTPVAWRGPLPTRDRNGDERVADVDLLLVVPDGGGSLAALDAYDGRVLAKLALPRAEGWFVSTPLVLEDRSVAIARQGYEPADAGLVVYRLRPSESAGADPTVADRYNASPTGDPEKPGGEPWP